MEHQTQKLDPTSSAQDWSGAVALVTGATSGIGKEIARLLLSEGLIVYIGARSPERARVTAAELGERARPLLLDVTDEASIAEAAGNVDQLDVLINNAGISIDAEPPTESDADVFRRTYETNVFGVVGVTNTFLPALRRSTRPRIVNISSGTGSLTWSTGPNPQFSHQTGGRSAAYRSSKTALNALTVFYGQALESDGFKVNALAPGLRATNLNPRAASADGDPAEAAEGAVRLALLPASGPTSSFFSWDGTLAAW